jgi:phosphatidylserine/phosphatidylglycerophosphate/cardiolipin synthase-like enzyme
MLNQRNRIINLFTYSIITIFLFAGCNVKDGKKLFGDPGFLFGVNSQFKVFWSEPGISRETAVDKGIDNEWAKFINEAEESVDVAIYNLGRQVIIDAIINARERGIKVRMVGDVDESTTKGYQTILRTDIPFSLGNPTGIQHNKFVVRDKKFVMMGTGNLSDTDLMLNNNNFALIQSKTLSESYSKEFEQMFYGRFASRKEPKTNNRYHNVNNIKLELYFSPYDGADSMNRLIELVDQAKFEINYMIFAMTHDELSTALIRAAKRGVKVRGIHDYTFIRGTAMSAGRLYNAGRFNPSFGPFNKEDGNENTKTPGLRTSGGKLHCKTMIFDRSIVATGSFNWSNNAINNNDENMLVIPSPLVANELLNQWEGIWNNGRPITNQINFSAGELASPGDIVFSEILWAGSYASGAASGSPNRDDVWLELKNTTNRSIDISNWIITWDPQELVHFKIPDKFSWYEPGVHKLHGSGKMIIEPNGYYLIKNTNDSLAKNLSTAFDNDASDLKISGTKNFRLNQSNMNLKLYDVTMNLIDQAGNGDPPSAGERDTVKYRTHSMERFFFSNGKAVSGLSPSAWYSSNGNNLIGSSVAGSGRISLDFKQCDASSQGCTIGTPNSAYSNNFPTANSNPSGGILGYTNIPIDAYSTGADSAAIRMRWPMKTAPSVTGASSVSISGDDPGLLNISVSQSPGTMYSVTVNNNGLDITESVNANGVISFTGYGLSKAQGYIEKISPAQSSSRDIVEVRITQGGSAKGLGVYYFDNNTLETPSLVYRVGDIAVATNDLLVFQLNSSGTISDDKKIGSNPTINNGGDGIWNFYSSDPGMPSTDAIVLLSYNPFDKPADLMCFSNQDGSIAEELMTWSFRYLSKNPDVFQLDGLFPVKDYNDFEIQARCSEYRNGGNGKSLIRVARNKNGKDFNCPGCSL